MLSIARVVIESSTSHIQSVEIVTPIKSRGWISCVEVICRSMGYAHGSISSSPCSFYGGVDLCGASGTPVVSLPFTIMCVACVVDFVPGGHGGFEMRWIGMECGRMLLVNA